MKAKIQIIYYLLASTFSYPNAFLPKKEKRDKKRLVGHEQKKVSWPTSFQVRVLYGVACKEGVYSNVRTYISTTPPVQYCKKLQQKRELLTLL